MKRSSSSSPNRNSRQKTEGRRQKSATAPWRRCALSLLTAYCLLLTGTTGCESLQKKFIRKPKPYTRPSPIVSFQDYTRAMTPLDRYRKHYAMFEYWNAELLDALGSSNANPKRITRTSSESLQELRVLQGLLREDLATQLGPLLKEREDLDRKLQRGTYAPSQLALMRRLLEAQNRQLHREFVWRKVEDRLKPQAEAPDAGAD